jgi:hypothetical protein
VQRAAAEETAIETFLAFERAVVSPGAILA